MLVSKVQHSHIDIISLHDAAEVLVGGKDTVETVVVDVGYNHLREKQPENNYTWAHEQICDWERAQIPPPNPN